MLWIGLLGRSDATESRRPGLDGHAALDPLEARFGQVSPTASSRAATRAGRSKTVTFQVMSWSTEA